jgi:hypothetical protein
MIRLLAILAQAATEYGAMAGEVGGSGPWSGPAGFLSDAPAWATDNPIASGGIVLTVLLILSLFRTRRYRL